MSLVKVHGSKDRIILEENKKKMSESKGRIFSEETKKNISKARKGRRNQKNL